MFTCANSAPQARSAATVCGREAALREVRRALHEQDYWLRLQLLLDTFHYFHDSSPPIQSVCLPRSRSSRRRSTASITCHRCAVLIDDQQAISARLRRHPLQYPPSSSLQILMHGDSGSSRSASAAETIELPVNCRRWVIELSGVVAYSSNPLQPATANNEPGEPYESTQFRFRRRSSWRRAGHHRVRGHSRSGLQRAVACALDAHPVRRDVDRPALLLQRRPDPGAGRRGGRQGRPGRRGHHASTSRLARCSGFAGRLSRPGSPAPGISRAAATSAAPSGLVWVATR